MKRLALMVILILLVVPGLVYIAITVYLRRQVSQYDEYWSRLGASSASEEAIYYVALGDSAAQGIGASRPQNGYVGLLANAIGDNTSRPVHVINISRSGARVADVLKQQIPELETLNIPDTAVITLEIGSNDMRDFDAERFESQMQRLLKSLPSTAIVAEIPYFGGRSRAPERDGRVAKANVIINAKAKELGMVVAQLHDVTRRHQSFRLYAADFFHPSDYGYRIWYQAFWQVIELGLSD